MLKYSPPMKKVFATTLGLFLLFTCCAETLESGLLGEYFYCGPTLRDFPDLGPKQKPTLKRIDHTIDFPKAFRMKGLRLTNDYYVRWTGKIRVAKTDKYKFFLESDDGSKLFVYDRQVVNNEGLHGMKEVSGEVELTAGDHPFRIDYFQGGSVGGCRLSWESKEIEKQIIPSSALWHEAITSPPTPEPGAGLVADFFDMGFVLKDVPDFQEYEKPTLSRTDLIIAFPDAESFSFNDLRDHFYARWLGKIEIPRSGSYTFTLSSDDGSLLKIDGKEVIDHGGTHKMSDKSGKVQLTEGPHDIKVDYFQSEGTAGCILFWEGPGIKREVVPRTAFSH